MKKVVIFKAPTLTQSGYGIHARQCARWLLSKQDIDVKFILTHWGSTPWILDREVFGGLAGQIMERSIAPDQLKSRADVSVQLLLPNEWDPKLATQNVGMTAGVETDRCNPAWITSCNAMDSVIVPSEHTKNCLTNSGVITTKLSVVPESWIDACETSQHKFQQFSTDFNFLVFGQITGNDTNDRKNTFNTLKWLFEAFKNDKNVGIVLKTNAGRNSKIDRQFVKNLVNSFVQEHRKYEFPKLHLVHGELSDDEVVSLYKHPQIKALVTLTRGEGFGLPILEAAACDLPVIATGWSGHMDFMKLGKFVDVFYQLQEISKSRIDDNIFMKGARWASASEEDFKKRVTKFYSSPEVPKQWAKELGSKLRQSFSFKQICNYYDIALKGII